MEIVKIIGIGLISVVLIILFKQYKPDFVIYISLLAGILIIILVMDKFTEIISIISNLVNKAGINNQFLKILLKITGIAILTEYASSICNDAGETAISNKIDFASKIIIIGISIPIISSLLEIILNILP